MSPKDLFLFFLFLYLPGVSGVTLLFPLSYSQLHHENSSTIFISWLVATDLASFFHSSVSTPELASMQAGLNELFTKF